MLNLIRSNWREAIAVLILLPILVLGLLALGVPGIAESPAASTLVSVIVSILGGICRFVVCVALGWFGLLSFPEANKFVLGTRFDSWWQHLNDDGKARVSLAAVAVLVLTAALCLAA